MVNSDIFFPCKIPRIFDGSVQMYKKAYSMKNEHCNFGVILFASQPSASQPFTSRSVHFYSQGKYPIHSHRTCTHFTCIFAYIWLKSTPWKIKSTFHFLLCFSSSKGTLKVQKVHLKYSLTKRIYIFFHLLLQRIYDLLSQVL